MKKVIQYASMLYTLAGVFYLSTRIADKLFDEAQYAMLAAGVLGVFAFFNTMQLASSDRKSSD